MRFLIISQVYWPDSTAVSQILTDLAEDLVRKGHTVSVISSSREYERPSNRFPARETRAGVHITRTGQTSFGKGSIIGRLADVVSFNVSLAFSMIRVRKSDYDVVIGLTVPPMVSFLGRMVAQVKGMKFAYWAMDLQPELAIATGYLKANSLSSRVLSRMARSVYRRADVIFALDRFMADHIVSKGGDRSKIVVVPVWAVAGPAYDGPRLENPFRVAQRFGDRIVVMYSGNHSAYNPLDTVLRAALALRDDPRFLFVFIGGGVRKKDVTEFRVAHGLDNIRDLPLQDRSMLSESLASADLHIVSLGDGCTGFTHPSKVYGILFIKRPILYVGPRPSHVSDILEACPGNLQVAHGDDARLVADLCEFAERSAEERAQVGATNFRHAAAHFSRAQLSGQMIAALERLGL